MQRTVFNVLGNGWGSLTGGLVCYFTHILIHTSLRHLFNRLLLTSLMVFCKIRVCSIWMVHRIGLRCMVDKVQSYIVAIPCTDPRQATLESNMRNGWVDGGSRKVKKEAVERLQVTGWDDVRPALRTTVWYQEFTCSDRVFYLTHVFIISGWFMQAYVSSHITQQYDCAVELYRQAVEILEWGRREWKDVPSEDKGSMFELTYIRAVKRLYMITITEVCKFLRAQHNPTCLLIFQCPGI